VLEVVPEYHRCKKLFKEAGWHLFFAKFRGFNDQVSLQFTQSFDGRLARVTNLEIEVTEETIANVTGLPRTGEYWFKKLTLGMEICNRFLKAQYQNVSWAKGVPRAYLMDEWQAPLVILQRYLTCEGRYALTYQYHVRILLHFESKELINFPYYLHKSLEKMAKMVRRNSQNPQK
jgi:hypothetical protein